MLSQICAKVEDSAFGPELESFGQDLIATMESAQGLGLAAPQVGGLQQIFAMRHQQSSIVVVNPKIRGYGEIVGHTEGCLSVPGLEVWIERPRQVVLQYQLPLTGETQELDLADIEAFCAQHEDDHTRGIMIFDRKRVSRQIHRQALREWEKLSGFGI